MKKSMVCICVFTVLCIFTACDEAMVSSFVDSAVEAAVSQVADVVNEPNPEPQATQGANAGGVNAETFALLRNGMSINEVQEIIGVTPTSETTTELLGITSTTIMWVGRSFSSITVMFTDGYATIITQMGL